MNLTRFLLAWRTTHLPDREVVDALVHPDHGSPSRELAGALAEWPGPHYWSSERDGRHLILTRRLGRTRRERWLLHLALFTTTLFTTTFVGAALAGTIPYNSPFDLFSAESPMPASAWLSGFMFSIPLLAVLLTHELAHYLVARRYQLDVSPPYFIPFPLVPIGTMGAFIRLRTVLADRRQLIDVGAAGPLAGFALALPVLWIGLAMSRPLPGHGAIGGMLLAIGGTTYGLGDSLITLALRHLTHPGAAALLISPLGFAGWVGMFVTMLNLLPISQLDGGHILYAALPRWQRRVAITFWGLIVLLGWFWRGWILWGVLVLVLSRGRLGHPPVLDTYRPMPRSRRALAWAILALFVATFAPVPFKI